MKLRILMLLPYVIFYCSTANAISFRHWNTTYVNAGICSASFLFDSDGKDIKNLKLEFKLLDPSNKSLGTEVIEIEKFGQAAATRYSFGLLESENMCTDNLRLILEKGTATVDGQAVDLIKTKQISISQFEPMKISIQPSPKPK